MQIKTEEDQKELLAALLIIAKQVERSAFERYYADLRIQTYVIRRLVESLDPEGAFRAFEWQEAEKVLVQVMQPVLDDAAEVLYPRLAGMVSDVQEVAGEFIGRQVTPTLRSRDTIGVTAMSGTSTLDEMLGSGQRPGKMAVRMAENIKRVVRLGLLTERPSIDIADDVQKVTVKAGKDVPLIARGTAVNQNLNIMNNFVREVVWDVVSQSTQRVWNEAGAVNKWIWSSRLDPNTCPICAPLDQEIVDEPWEFESIPPVHPNCRCLILPLRVD